MDFDDEYNFDLDAAIEEEQMIEEEEMDLYANAGLMDADDGEEPETSRSPISTQKKRAVSVDSPESISYHSSP